MSDPSEKLKAALSTLHAELERLEDASPEEKQLLQSALTDIQSALEVATQESPPTAEEHESLLERLTESAQHFEDSHPTLSGMVGSVIDALGRMGV